MCPPGDQGDLARLSTGTEVKRGIVGGGRRGSCQLSATGSSIWTEVGLPAGNFFLSGTVFQNLILMSPPEKIHAATKCFLPSQRIIVLGQIANFLHDRKY